MISYKIRVSPNPDVFEPIEFGSIVYGDYIETTNGSRVTREAWQGGKPVVVPSMMVYTRDKFLLAMPIAVQIEMQMIMDGAIPIGGDAAEIATNLATLKVVDRSFTANPIIESANAETQAMYDILEAIVPSFTDEVRTMLETGE